MLQLPLRPLRPPWWPDATASHALCQKRLDVNHFRRNMMDSMLLSYDARTFHSRTPAYLRSYRFQLLSLKGIDLNIGDTSTASSDPYCVFQGPAVLKCQCTPFLRQNLNPIWPTASLPSFSVVALNDDPQALAFERVMITVIDFDSFSAHDRIGGAVLHIKDHVNELGVPLRGKHTIDLPLLLKGVPAGRLQGSFTIEQETNVSTGIFLKEKGKEKKRINSFHRTLAERLMHTCAPLRISPGISGVAEQFPQASAPTSPTARRDNNDDDILRKEVEV